MTIYAVPPAGIRSLAVSGTKERFPVNRIFCVGRNYAAHAREMGMDPDRIPPFFFMKPASALVEVLPDGVTIPYPPMTNNYHHEIELVLALGNGGANITAAKAWDHIYGYAVGLDMTRRDLQLDACSKKQPWEFGKSFSQSAPIGPVYRAEQTGNMTNGSINLEVNGLMRQSSNIDQLTWSIPEIISHLSQYETLQAGDLIMTGTPEGVGSVVRGDTLVGNITGLGKIKVTIGGN